MEVLYFTHVFLVTWLWITTSPTHKESYRRGHIVSQNTSCFVFAFTNSVVLFLFVWRLLIVIHHFRVSISWHTHDKDVVHWGLAHLSDVCVSDIHSVSFVVNFSHFQHLQNHRMDFDETLLRRSAVVVPCKSFFMKFFARIRESGAITGKKSGSISVNVLSCFLSFRQNLDTDNTQRHKYLRQSKYEASLHGYRCIVVCLFYFTNLNSSSYMPDRDIWKMCALCIEFNFKF